MIIVIPGNVKIIPPLVKALYGRMRSFNRIFYRCFLIIFFFADSSIVSAQNKFSVIGGWGYYERANTGVQWNFSERSSLSLYGGNNFGLNDHMSWTAGLSFVRLFKKPLFTKLTPGYSLGALFWTNEDELYNFRSLSFPFMPLLSFPVSGRISILGEGGVIFTNVIESDRRQNVEAGFPARFNGNLRFSIIYKLR